MTEAARHLAIYLDQRRRLGDPGVIPEALAPDEFVALAAKAQERGAAGRPGDGNAPLSPASANSAENSGTLAEADYETLKKHALACTRCTLAEGRTRVVFADGNPRSRLMVVGEAPGEQEDRTGLPFVGRAGKLLDLILAAVGLSRRDSVYICNVVKCRPPKNRNPRPDEIEACADFLRGQIRLVGPAAILAVGSFAAQSLTGEPRPIGKLRGKVYHYEGIPLVATYHPAALLRNSGWNRLCWDDLQILCKILDQS